jgi:ribonucleoside-diphosphate reductase alpha chain
MTDKKSFDVFSNSFSQSIYQQKYSLDGQETWADTARRVTDAVCGQLLSPEDKEAIYKIIVDRKFIPGGRYLYSAGRPFHQVNNCFLFRAEDSREGWADLMSKITSALMTGGGIGVDYSALREEGAPVKKTGGFSTGPLALMQMVNEAARHIMQGGQRRSAVYASLNWKHPDIFKFLAIKNHSPELRALKEKDLNFPLPMELTNISVNYDTEFFIAIEDEKHQLHEHAKKVYTENCHQAFSTAEPGFSFNFRKDNETLRNACVTGDTEILTADGYVQIKDIVDTEVEVWNGFEWSKVTPKITGRNQDMVTVTLSDGRTLKCTEYHKFHIATDYRGGKDVIEAVNLAPGMKLIKHEFPIIEHGPELRHAYTQGFVAAEGMELSRTLYVYPPKECCLGRIEGIKLISDEVNNKRKRIVLEEVPVSKSMVPITYNLKSKLDWLAGLFDGDGTELKEGGLQLVSVNHSFLEDVQKLLSTVGVQSKITLGNVAGKRWMPDGKGGQRQFECLETRRICIGAVQMQHLKRLGLKCERMPFDKEPQRDASQFVNVVDVTSSGTEEVVYCFTESRRNLGVFNGVLTGQCCEVVSEDDSDKCNLGTMWINRIKDKKELKRVTKYATMFLMCGGIYSDVPNAKIKEVGLKNNRIGLGLGGIHEWLMARGMKYEVTPELHSWLKVYEDESDSAAFITAKLLGVAVPKGVRAIAPNGTIGIISETTTGIEPLFCKAYKRRYFKDGKWMYQYVVDGSVKRLLDQGVKLEDIQDSYDLTFKQRVKFQADVQNYVDMAISSTCNVAPWGSEDNNEKQLEANGAMLLRYAKRLRGFTIYPDGCRGGQPLTRVSLEEALANEGTVFEETERECLNGVCGL